MRGEENIVKDYYDKNTSKFLFFHKDAGSRNIHQALWAEDEFNLHQAINYSNQLIVEQVEQYCIDQQLSNTTVLDLGCGVGSAVFYVAEQSDKINQVIGVTISPKQVALAAHWSKQLDQKKKCRFIEANFEQLPADLPSIDLAYSIEAFVHARSAKRYFEQASQQLKPKGRLILIDDFLSADRDQSNEAHRQAIERFQNGWALGSLLTETEVIILAERQNLHLVHQMELTPFLKVFTIREQAIRLMVQLLHPIFKRNSYFKSIIGGDARQYCLQRKLIQYRMLVFEKV